MFQLGDRVVGAGAPPLLVSEIGANHDGDVDKAETMVRALAAQGAEAIKFQLYTAEELVADADRPVTWGPPGGEVTEAIGPMFDRLALPREAVRDLMRLGTELGMISFATPFSEDGIDYLEQVGVPGYKVAASDVGHLPFLRHIAQTGKPVILSLGKCTLGEAEEAIDTLLAHGASQLSVLHCVAEYPAPIADMNLRTIPMLQTMYPEMAVGLSDHSIGTTSAVAAVALGASIVEKHVTLSPQDVGPDHWFSMAIDEVGPLQQAMHDAHAALGVARKQVTPGEVAERRTAIRSLVVRRPLKAGDRLRADDLKAVRPGTGLPPRYLEVVDGMVLTRDLAADTPVTWDAFR
ncbi:N-acetylneuraminate synthase family protein [Nocardioides humi]|uniref:Pseudaminic acid synthase n=1 Tax=Nocardioides humi TaxID=449461 RepID=A0ABN2B2N0_9ACTN|nr:N-acetylneuraminate synthase family protein [Nocardioides humi]